MLHDGDPARELTRGRRSSCSRPSGIGFGAAGGMRASCHRWRRRVVDRRAQVTGTGVGRRAHQRRASRGGALIGAHVPAASSAPATLALQAEGRVSDRAYANSRARLPSPGSSTRFRESHAARDLCLEMAAYTLHPYKLAAASPSTPSREGVQLHERSRVRKVEGHAGRRGAVHSREPRLEANKVVVCTNAYTPRSIWRAVGAPVVHSFMTATGPRDGGSRDGITAEGSTAGRDIHRMHGDRIIHGGIDKVHVPRGTTNSRCPRQRHGLAMRLEASFPGDATHDREAWSGCSTRRGTGSRLFDESEKNPPSCSTWYGGTGVALSLVCARLAASVARTGRSRRRRQAANGVDPLDADSVRDRGGRSRRSPMAWRCPRGAAGHDADRHAWPIPTAAAGVMLDGLFQALGSTHQAAVGSWHSTAGHQTEL